MVSALVAMGRSNNPNWENEVLDGIQHYNDLIQLEAIQAAGNLGLETTRLVLLELLEDLNDTEIIKATLWSLSQIGGEGVREKIEDMYEQLDPDEEDFIDEVVENLNLTEEMATFDFLVVDADPELSDELDMVEGE